MIKGAAITASALENAYGLKGKSIGSASPIVRDDWTESLAQAKDTLNGLGEALRASFRAGNFPVISANTSSASLASLPVVAQENPDVVVLYIDGRGDFNTPDTTDSGYLGGMVLSGACGYWDSGHGSGLRPDQAILVGSRDIDEAERRVLSEAGVRIIPPTEATGQAVADAAAGSRVWIHIDWDVLEPGFVPGDYKVPNGLLPQQLREILQAFKPEQIVGIEMAEFAVSGDTAADAAGFHTVLDIVTPVIEGARARITAP